MRRSPISSACRVCVHPLDAVSRLPQRIATIADRLESGTLQVGVVPSALAETEHMLRSVGNRVGAALIIVGLLVASALMANVDHWISGVGFVVAFVLALHVLWKIIGTPGEL